MLYREVNLNFDSGQIAELEREKTHLPVTAVPLKHCLCCCVKNWTMGPAIWRLVESEPQRFLPRVSSSPDRLFFSRTHLQTDSKASWDSAGCGGNGCHCATCWKTEETLNLGLGNNHAIVIPFNNSHIIRKASRCILEIYKLYIIEKHNITDNFSTQRWPCSCFVSYTKIFFKSLIITYKWF